MVWFYNKELDLLSKVGDSTGAKTYDVHSHSFSKHSESDIGMVISDMMARRILLRIDIDFAINVFMKSQKYTFGEIGTDSLFGGRLAVKFGERLFDIDCSYPNGHLCFTAYHTEDLSFDEFFWEIDHEVFRDKLYCLANKIPSNGDFSTLSYYPEWWTSESCNNFGEMRFFSDADQKLYLCDASGFQLGFEPINVEKKFSDLPSKSGRVFLGNIRPICALDHRYYHKLNLSEGCELTTREVDWLVYEMWEKDRDNYYESCPEYQENEEVDYRDEDYSDELGPECNWPDYD